MAERHPHAGTWQEVLGVFFRLGLTSFGGPVAHLGYFRETFVVRRQWLDERAYADLIALCQFLPGPASSQTGLAIGLARAGLPGALAAWTGFTLPSALALVLFAYGLGALGEVSGAGWLGGLKIAAVAVVAQAVFGMARSLCPDRERATFAVFATLIVLAVPGALGQVGAIALGGLAGLLLLRSKTQGSQPGSALQIPLGRRFALVCLALFFTLLLGLPLLRAALGSEPLALFETFYRAGSLVFGGGHVVLPLLQEGVVGPGWVSEDAFLAGYGAAQAVPGPLFTFSAYLGVMTGQGLAGAVIALVGIFLPAFLLVFGTLPFWALLRARPDAQAALAGVNAAVVGLLLAALYDPVWTSAIHRPADFGLAATAFLALQIWRLPPWLVVVGAAVIAGLLASLA
jgi:chromate transporter